MQVRRIAMELKSPIHESLQQVLSYLAPIRIQILYLPVSGMLMAIVLMVIEFPGSPDRF